MNRWSIVFTSVGVILSFKIFAAERAFQVYSSKTLTPHVERLYGQDGSAFATVFCKDQAHQVMIVDSRLTDLDGKNFFFNDLSQCKKAQTDAHDFYNKCTVNLLIDQQAMTAKVTKAGCQ